MANKNKQRKEKQAAIKLQLEKASVLVAEEEYETHNGVAQHSEVNDSEILAEMGSGGGYGEDGGVGSEGDSEDEEMARNALTEARKSSQSSGKKKRRKLTCENLKRLLQRRLGNKGVELWGSVDMHTGNAEHSVFLSQLLFTRRTVPVPFHWKQLSVFLSKQLDREESNIVPEVVEDTNVRHIRKNKISNVNVAAFAQCFVTANPLALKSFSVVLSGHGKPYYSNMWRAPQKHQPGKLSKGLRQALGIDNTSALPWLHEMQAVEELPPSRPTMQVPGMNAPIPAGGNWGRADGQWGNPPRDSAGNYLYPTVRGDVETNRPRPFGSIPPRRLAQEQQATSVPAAPVPSAMTQPSTSSAAASRIVIKPSPFLPGGGRQAQGTFTGIANAVIQPEEYYRTMVGEDDLQEVGERVRSKAGAARSRHTLERSRHNIEADLLKY